MYGIILLYQSIQLWSVELTVPLHMVLLGLTGAGGIIVVSLTPDAPTMAAKRLGIHQA